MQKDSEVNHQPNLDSKSDSNEVMDQSNVVSEEDELQKAIAMSLEGRVNLILSILNDVYK